MQTWEKCLITIYRLVDLINKCTTTGNPACHLNIQQQLMHFCAKGGTGLMANNMGYWPLIGLNFSKDIQSFSIGYRGLMIHQVSMTLHNLRLETPEILSVIISHLPDWLSMVYACAICPFFQARLTWILCPIVIGMCLIIQKLIVVLGISKIYHIA